MIFASGHSIFWRLTDQSDEGSDAVSVVLTNSRRQALAEVAVDNETDSALRHSDTQPETIDIEWDKRDLELFLTLLRNTVSQETESVYPQQADQAQEVQQIELDLNDDSVVHILQIVAAARFATPYPAEPVINAKRSLIASVPPCSVGELISIDTIDGLKPGVVVAEDDGELHCVLLDEITSPAGDNIRFDRHDIIILKRELALPGSFTHLQPGRSETIH